MKIKYSKDLILDDVLDTLGLAKIGVQGLFDPLKADTVVLKHDIQGNFFLFGNTESSRALARLFYVFAVKEFGQNNITAELFEW